MEKIEIMSSVDSYRIGEHRNDYVFGEFWIRIGQFCFPHKEWGDLVASCSISWMDSLFRLKHNKTGEKERFIYMDGPYYFYAEKTREGNMKLAFWARDKKSNMEVIVDQSNFYEQVISLASRLLTTLENRPGQKENVNNLKEKLAKMLA